MALKMETASKKSKGCRHKKVWHITDFRELFELPDDLRKDRPGPLTYTKSFVTLTPGSKEVDIKHFERLEELKSRQERHLLRSIFEDIKNWSGKKTIRHRGFLLTTSEQPATYEYLAGQLKVAVEELEKAMPVLEEIGLVEKVTMDMLPTNGKLTKGTKRKGRCGGATRQKSTHKKNHSKKGEAPDASGQKRTNPAASGTKRMPLYNSTKGNDKKKSNETKANGNGKGKNKEEIKRLRKDKAKAPKDPPTTTQPVKPQVSAKRGSVIQFSAPSELQNTGRLGEITKKILHRYNPDSKQFAYEVYQALAFPWDPTSEEGKRELGCFASVWEKAVGWQNAGIPMTVIDELRERAITEARKIAKRRQNRKKGAVWIVVFNNLVAAYKRRA